MDLLNLEIPTNVKIAKKQVFSFGDEQDIKNALPELFKLLEPSITNFQWYAFYDKIASWLSNDNGNGIITFAEEGGKNNGIGKSLFATKVYPTILKNFSKPEKQCTIINCIDLTKEKLYDLLSNEGQIVLIIDELGREPKVMLDYGNEIRPMEMIFEKAERCGWKLIVNTNMTEKQTHLHYSSMHLSERIRSMCLAIHCSGKSSRRTVK